LGASLGSIPALLVGGWVAARYGLRDVFLLAGLPVVALAILIRLLVASRSGEVTQAVSREMRCRCV
jgi:MFS family permease